METVEAHGARIPIVGFGSMRLKEDAGRRAPFVELTRRVKKAGAIAKGRGCFGCVSDR